MTLEQAAEIAELRENLKIAHEALIRIAEHPCVLEAHALSGIAAAALIGMGVQVVDRATGEPFSHVNVSGWLDGNGNGRIVAKRRL